jgi:hypothetical protein
MKRTLYLCLLASTFFVFSCKKDKNNSKSRTELVSEKAWILDEYYTGYNTSTPILAYKRGRANNAYEADNYSLKFNSNGTYTRTQPDGTQFSGTWVWLNNETDIQSMETAGTSSSTVVELTPTSYIWNSTGSGTYAKMIHP